MESFFGGFFVAVLILIIAVSDKTKPWGIWVAGGMVILGIPLSISPAATDQQLWWSYIWTLCWLVVLAPPYALESIERAKEAKRKDAQKRTAEEAARVEAKRKDAQKRAAEEAARVEAKRKEAERIEANRIKTVITYRENSLLYIYSVESCLEHAEHCFKEQLFVPFWEKVKETQQGVEVLAENDRKYKSLINEHNHLLKHVGGVIYAEAELIKMESIDQQLKDVLHRAHSDFEFASIYMSIDIKGAIISVGHRIEGKLDTIVDEARNINKSMQDVSRGVQSVETAVKNVGDSVRDVGANIETAVENVGDSVRSVETTMEDIEWEKKKNKH